MRPLPGRSVVAEFASRFDADLARARLWEAGLESTVLGDPAQGVAPHHVTDRLFHLVVRDEVVDHARSVLAGDRDPDPEADDLDHQFHRHRFADRPTWVRWATWTLLAAIAGPVALAGLLQLFWIARSLFP